jgi:integrase
MSLRPCPIGSVPEETARVARAAFPRGSAWMRLRDELRADLRGRHVCRITFAPWPRAMRLRKHVTPAYKYTHELRAVQDLLGHTDPRTTARYRDGFRVSHVLRHLMNVRGPHVCDVHAIASNSARAQRASIWRASWSL